MKPARCPQAESYSLFIALWPISDTCKSSPQLVLVQGQLKWLLKLSPCLETSMLTLLLLLVFLYLISPTT